MSENPIFVVGAPRSGTTLLAATLTSHSQIDCGPETQFFNKLSATELSAAVDDRHWPGKAVHLLGSLTLADQPVHTLFSLSQQDLFVFLKSRTPSIGAMLEALTEQHATRSGKRRWAEKTPNHILHLDQIRREFPNAHIVRIVRDPRDSAQSMRKLAWASQSVLANCYTWRQWYEASEAFFGRDRLCKTVFLEKLVQEPEEQMRALCEFLKADFEPSMLKRQTAASVMSPQEWWKSDVSKPLQSDRVFTWKQDLNADMATAASVICHTGIDALQYEANGAVTHTRQVYKLDAGTIEENEQAIITAAKAGVEFVQSRSALRQDVLIVLPRPKRPLLPTMRSVARLVLILMLRRLMGRTNILLRRRPATVRWWSRASAGISRVLGRTYSPDDVYRVWDDAPMVVGAPTSGSTGVK